jgi:alkylation response protein AidB-like acyl-CoA dehydrogenase
MLPTELVGLTDEQRTIVDLCRAFGAEEIRPAVRAVGAEIQTPWELWRAAAKAGITAFMLPSEYGGGGFTDVVTQCLVQQELSVADAGIANLLTSGGLFAGHVLELGTAEQKERWIRPLTSDDPPMTAQVMTEPGAGDDPTAITTKARRVGGGYKLTGQNSWISNGGVADFYVIFATLDAVTRANGVTAFLVTKGTPGLTFGPPVPRAGQHTVVTTEVFLDHVFVPDASRLGAEGQGLCGLTRSFDIARTMLAASAVGSARACHESAVSDASNTRLADMATRIESSSQLVFQAAKLLDDGEDASAVSELATASAAETAAFCSAEKVAA